MLLLLAACNDPAPTGDVALLDFDGEPPANLLVLSLDTLRRDFVGRYAGTEDSPFLDGLLESSVVLDDHGSCSNWTVASFVCLNTGASSLDLGFEPLSGDPSVPDLPSELSAWPEALLGLGFDTGLVSANPFLRVEAGWALGAGFRDHWLEANAVAEILAEEALERVDGLRSPWLLQVHFMDTHEPYVAPEQFREPGPEIAYDLSDPEEVRRLESDWLTLDLEERADIQAALAADYRAEVRYLDHHLERLWEALDERGALDETLVLVVSDHGQQHLERARWAHGNHLNQEETAAIAAFWARGLAPRAWTGLTTHQDLGATLDVLYGLDLERVTGAVIGEAAPSRPRFQQHYRTHDPEKLPTARQAVVTETHRLSYAWDGVQHVHDRLADPAEAVDVIETLSPELLAELWDLLEPEVARYQDTLLSHREPEDAGP